MTNTTTILRTGVVLVTALLLQVAVIPWVTIIGVQVDLLLLVTLAAGLSGGPERGARVGFVAGILWDLVVAGPVVAWSVIERVPPSAWTVG